MDLKKRKLDENGSLDITPEDVKKLIEPFSKEQLMDIVQEAASRHLDVLDDVRKLADKDPAHRKLFVRGLGWDTTSETLKSVFTQYGELDEAVVIADKGSGKSKGYGFVTFKHMDGAQRALKESSKKIDGRMAVCQLASAGPSAPQATHDQGSRKIYVGNVPIDFPADKVLSLFSQYGEIEEGPLGFDKQTGRSRGFALLIYKTVESAKRALEEPLKSLDGHQVHCKLAEGQKQKAGQVEGADAGGLHGGGGVLGAGSNISFPSSYAGGLPINQGLSLALNQGLSSHSLTPSLAAQSLHSAMNPSQSLANLNPSVAQQLALNSSISPSLSNSINSSYHSSLGASLTQGGSQGLTHALGPLPSSAGLAAYGLHGLGSYGSHVHTLGGPQSPYSGLVGTSLYGLPASAITSQTGILQATAGHHSLSPLQSSHLSQASGSRGQSFSSYFTN